MTRATAAGGVQLERSAFGMPDRLFGRVDDAGQHAVDADAVVLVLEGEHARQGHHARLGHGVGGGTRAAALHHLGPDGDDRAARPPQVGDRGPADRVRAVEVRMDHGRPLVGGRLRAGAPARIGAGDRGHAREVRPARAAASSTNRAVAARSARSTGAPHRRAPAAISSRSACQPSSPR